MFTFLRGGRGRRRKSHDRRGRSPYFDSPETSRYRAVARDEDDETEPDEEDDDEDVDELSPLRRRTEYLDEEAQDDAEEDEEVETPLLPLFSAAHLDKLPLYNITHAIRLLIEQRCETTLSWDQLRSPQVSQFLVKPIQSQIRANQFNRATLCALIANCLQFQKEAQLHPGNIGVLNTRALISELLAMRLCKEFTTRELIDALSYEFDPLQGMTETPPATAQNQNDPSWAIHSDLHHRRAQGKGARVSTIEIAIRAQAKRFLSHPLVVQHLEAIWAGTIVFHSEADNLHRLPSTGEEPYQRIRAYGTINNASISLSHKDDGTIQAKKDIAAALARRSVTLYNPRDASLFKLSRLRVPRYRQVFSTISFAIMLGLFIAVLLQRSLYITPLEVLFWFWSVGYMLDEVVGFSEQGFGLYILSFWNAFDLGILLLFVIYYCLRLYGIVLAEENKRYIANAAYDVLASTAILLFPRLFSVLDHYRYFSQLLIAFRMMAQDLMAVFVLIFISCSGFFVAFTLSFADEKTNASNVAFALFQIVMGFTPAAWDKWAGYNMLGKALMGAFLIICHFVIVTILITVLTNSFMAIVKNAHEEHQFLFAVNTISMVKSDALFSYIAPSNVVGWMLTPMRYVMPFRQFVKLNRMVIKITHFPVLFGIFGYERLIMSKRVYEPMDLVEKKPRTQHQPIAFTVHRPPDAFSTTHRLLREPSTMSLNKDRALDEVFRRPFKGSTVRTTPRDMAVNRRSSVNVVDKWMQAAEIEGGASPPLEQPRSVVERLENRRASLRPASTDQVSRSAKHSRVFSDPDLASGFASRRPSRVVGKDSERMRSRSTLPQDTDADGDDENNLDSDVVGPTMGESALSILDKENRDPRDESDDQEDLFPKPTVAKSQLVQRLEQARGLRRDIHARKVSAETALFVPRSGTAMAAVESANNTLDNRLGKALQHGNDQVPEIHNFAPSRQSPKRKDANARPIMPPRLKTAPNVVSGVGLSFLETNRDMHRRRQPSFNARALDLASDIGDNKWVSSTGIDAGGISGMPNSFSEQLLRENELKRRQEEQRRRTEDEEKGMVNRIMLARMHTLEEGFKEVLKEIRVVANNSAVNTNSTVNSSRVGSDVDTAVQGSGGKRRRLRAGKVLGEGRGSAKEESVVEGSEARTFGA